MAELLANEQTRAAADLCPGYHRHCPWRLRTADPGMRDGGAAHWPITDIGWKCFGSVRSEPLCRGGRCPGCLAGRHVASLGIRAYRALVWNHLFLHLVSGETADFR